jgi:hypothetical protein
MFLKPAGTDIGAASPRTAIQEGSSNSFQYAQKAMGSGSLGMSPIPELLHRQGLLGYQQAPARGGLPASFHPSSVNKERKRTLWDLVVY